MKEEARVLRRHEALEQARSFVSVARLSSMEILAQEWQFVRDQISQMAQYSHLQDFSSPGPQFGEYLRLHLWSFVSIEVPFVDFVSGQE